eukprot:scaffold122264_cov41-Tisochrysis_lutea.AAC.2
MGKASLQPLPTGQQQYMVVGRFVPNAKYGEAAPMCKVYRMKLFAKNIVCARSRFWYFMGRLCRVKKANGQIISVNQVREVEQRCLMSYSLRGHGASQSQPFFVQCRLGGAPVAAVRQCPSSPCRELVERCIAAYQ